jgi:predicted metal-dependent phosphotriesterase family hydrolase
MAQPRKRHDGGCLVDQTSIGMARDPVGLQHIPETVTSLMRCKGFDQSLIDRILITNPATLLEFA